MISFTPRKYPEPPPEALRLVDGKIVLADGSDATEYLKAWAREAGVTSDTPINLLRRDSYVKCRDESVMFQFWGA